MALDTLEKLKYTPDSVCSGKDPIEFVTEVITAAAGAGLALIQELQAAAVYQYFSGELRRDLVKPTGQTTIQQFMRQVIEKHNI